MADPFESNATGLESPARDWFDITLADADLSTLPRAIACTGAGEVDIQSEAGTTVTVYLQAGIPYPYRAIRVKSTTGSGSDATGVVGLY